MDQARKSVLAANLRRLIPRPWGRFAQRIGANPKNLYTYLREKRPSTMPSPLLAAIARELHLSMDDLLSESPAVGPKAIPIVGRATAGPLVPDAPQAARTIRLEIDGLLVTVTVEPAGGG